MAVNEIIETDGNKILTGTDENDKIYGGKGNDKIYGDKGNDTIYGGNGDDYIRGGDGDDVIYGGNGEDDITGGKGNDTITGGNGVTHIVHVRGDGDDVVYLTKGENLYLYFGEENESSPDRALSSTEVSYKYSADKKDLIIYSDKNDDSKGSITLKNFAAKDVTNNATKKSEDTSSVNAIFSDKVVNLRKDITVATQTDKNFTGTRLNDKIDASDAVLYKKAGKTTIEKEAKDKGLTLDGGKGNDIITGTKYSDVIKGGDGDDIITGGKGNDTITGGAGSNRIDYHKGDGNDVINLTKGENLKIALNGFELSDNINFGYSANKKDLLIYTNNEKTEYITLKNFALKDITNNATKTTPDSSSVELTVNGVDTVNLKKAIVETETDKNFTGTRLNDKIDASDAVLYKKAGKTTIEKEAKDKGLTLDGGAGDDKITGTKYSDVLKGGDGDDIITGGKGNDTITGGAGSNRIDYHKGDGNDVINLTKGENLKIALNGFELSDNINFGYSANKKDLLIYTNNEKTEYITLKNFALKDITNNATKTTPDSSSVELTVNGVDTVNLKKAIVETETDKNFTGTRLNDKIDASDAVLYKKAGKTTIEKEAKDKGLTLDGGKGNDIITGTKYSDVIKGGDGDDIITGGKGNDTITGGVGENTLYYKKGDGCDVINLTKGENFKLVLSDVTDINNILVERSKNGKDILIFADKENKSEYITLKNYAVKDITNNATKKTEDTSYVILQIGEDEFDFRTQFGFFEKPTKNFTGSWLNDSIDASEYQLYDKKHNEINDSSKKGLTIDGGAGVDKITGTKYSDVLKGGDGYDEIHGGAGNDTIYGGNDINELYGDDGNDVIYGGADDDTIDGGKGNDTITGGAGTNKIIYKHGDGNDVVKLTKGEDLIIALPNVNNWNDIIFEIAPNGKDLIIRANNANRDEFMTIKDYVTKDILNSGKFLLGDSEREEYFDQIKFNVDTNKNFTGTRLNEEINANGATKGVTINSGAGYDTVYGSDYNDVIKGTSGSGGKTFSGRKGNDTIYGTNDYCELHGDEGDDKIYAGSKQDYIYGDAGNDYIKGGDGNDSIWGDTLSASESDGNDTIYGEGGNDVISGGGGNDYIDGGTGNDTIYGNAGNDTIIGGTGENKIIHKTGDGNDTIILTKGEDLTISLQESEGSQGPKDWSWIKMIYAENGKDLLIYPLQNKDEHITIKDFITKDVTNSITLDINGTKYDLKTGKNLTKPSERPLYVTNSVTKDTTGTWMADELNAASYTIYNESGDSISDPELKGLTLDGRAGNDIILGSKYSDVLKGGDGNDNITAYEGGNDTIYGEGGNDKIFGGGGDDYIDGGTGNDYISGGAGNDTLNGGIGSDTLSGGAGDDNIEGGDGNDTIYGGDGNDTIYGGDGNDTIYGDAGDDYIEGGKGNDTIKGGEGNDTIYGGDGNDTIYGGAGDDNIEGGKGNDTIYGEGGNDKIFGGGGDDTIYGGAGNDTLDGGIGSDTLYGGAGDDTYIVYFADNAINSVIEDESGTNDVVNFKEWPTGPETCTKDKLHVAFNVSKDFDKSTDTISQVNILDDTNFDSWKTNPTGDFEGVKIKDNVIETINSSDNYFVTSADIATLAESVAAWLTEKGYNDVNAALASENSEDIEALIAKFADCNWQASI